MTDDRIPVGIAGLGRSGWNIHARLLAEAEGKFRIAAVTDESNDRCEEAKARFGCSTYGSFDELIADRSVALVVVALPSHLHADATVSALAAGKHVVCEKPMATCTSDADRMIAADANSPGSLAIFHNRRYSPDFVTVREVVKSGVLGRVVLIHMTASGFGRRWDWQTLRECGGGSLNNTAVHALDQALLLMGEGTVEVSCHLEQTLTLGDAEDHVKLILTMPGAPMVDLEASSVCAYAQPSWHIMGTRGGLTGSANSLRWKHIDEAALPERVLDRCPTPDRSYNHEDYQWAETEWDREEYQGPGDLGFYLDLFESIRHGAPVPVTPVSVRRVVSVLEECHRSAGI